MDARTIRLVGRRSSLFTRIALIVAHELGLAVELEVVPDMTRLDPAAYGGHPALKLPLLRHGDGIVGTTNICRVLGELAGASEIIWPEQLRSPTVRNAQELVEHAMASQIQLVMGTVIGKLPADNIYFVKVRAGLEGALRWLDAHVDAVRAELAAHAGTSLLEVQLFCLVEHLAFRPTVELAAYPRLAAFAAAWGERASARATAYRFDAPPAPRADPPG